MTSAAHLTNALCSASVTPQQGKCPVVGITNLSELRRMTSRARNGSGFFMVRRSGPRERAVPQCGVCNPVRLAAHEITNSDGQVFETLLRRPLMAHPFSQAESANLTPFTYHSKAVRVTERGGETWFVAKDVCGVLSIKNNRDALTRLDADEKGVVLTDTLGGKQNVSIISESGLYALILRSDKPEAKPFRKWVTSEVLPSIRKTGQYAAPDELPFTMAELTAQARELLAMSSDLEAGAGRLRHKVSSLFSKAQHNGFYAPRALPAPAGKTNVRAHLRKLPRKGAV